MKIERDDLHLHHIADAISKIIKYAEEISYEQFAERDKYYDAILMQVVVIGEAFKSLKKNLAVKKLVF